MAKLGQLREAEERAQLEIEKAEREAQRIRLSIPDLIEDQEKERDGRLMEIARRREAEIQEKTESLREKLTKVSEGQLEKIESHGPELRKEAVERLRAIILNSGDR